MKREKNRFLPLGKSIVPASGSGRLYSVLSPPFDNRAQLSQHRNGPTKPRAALPVHSGHTANRLRARRRRRFGDRYLRRSLCRRKYAALRHAGFRLRDPGLASQQPAGRNRLATARRVQSAARQQSFRRRLRQSGAGHPNPFEICRSGRAGLLASRQDPGACRGAPRLVATTLARHGFRPGLAAGLFGRDAVPGKFAATAALRRFHDLTKARLASHLARTLPHARARALMVASSRPGFGVRATLRWRGIGTAEDARRPGRYPFSFAPTFPLREIRQRIHEPVFQTLVPSRGTEGSNLVLSATNIPPR